MATDKKIDEKPSMFDITQTINTDLLGDFMQEYAEDLQLEGANILICCISLDDLKNEQFGNIEKLNSFIYGDWNGLSSYVSDKEIEKIKKQFENDLQDFSEDEDRNVNVHSDIFSSYLYCNDDDSVPGSEQFQYKDYVWGGISTP